MTIAARLPGNSCTASAPPIIRPTIVAATTVIVAGRQIVYAGGRLMRSVMPSSWAISPRAKRLASSTMTVRTPLSSIRSRSSAKPGRSWIGSAPEQPHRKTRRRSRSRPAWRSPRWRAAVVSRCLCRGRHWRPNSFGNRPEPARGSCWFSPRLLPVFSWTFKF